MNKFLPTVLGNLCVACSILAFGACHHDHDPPTQQQDVGVDVVSPPEHCFNGIDDNGDLLVDCADESCRRLDACRTFQCPDGDLSDAWGHALFTGTTDGARDDLFGSCGGTGGADLALLWTAPSTASFYIDTRGSAHDSVLYVLQGGCDGPELVCNDDATSPSALQSEITLDAVAGQTYLIVVDGYELVGGSTGRAFQLNISPTTLSDETGFCTDRRDNDNDGSVDCDDADCAEDPSCAPLPAVTEFGLGRSTSCATDATATWCWGNNANGELGDGTRETRRTPAPLRTSDGTPLRLTRLSFENATACGIDSDGGLWCWGANHYNRLLLPEGTTHDDHPVRISLPAVAVDVSVGHTHTCAVLEDGRVACWGLDHAGQFGDGEAEPSGTFAPSPSFMLGMDDAVEVACGNRHTCVRTRDRDLWCAGSNDSGETGDEPGGPQPRRLAGAVDAVAVGASHTCIVRAGAFACVGPNWSGQLGTGNRVERRAFDDITLDAEIVDLTCASSACCAVTTDADAWCWGDNGWQWMGPDAPVGRVVTPTRFAAADVAAIGLGSTHACFTDLAGAVWCNGANASGQLGNRRSTQSVEPVRVLGPVAEEN